jgi:hypothetical protein
MTCPEHGFVLVSSHTRFGVRYRCAFPTCTVACWDGSTSTPADKETRDLRNRCHQLFDALWKSGDMSRNKAYRKLAYWMQLPEERAHIGMFDRAQCLKLISLLEDT